MRIINQLKMTKGIRNQLSYKQVENSEKFIGEESGRGESLRLELGIEDYIPDHLALRSCLCKAG